MQGQFRSSRAIEELDNLNSKWAICSGRHDEKVYDGDVGDNSPFTKSFISALNGNDRNGLNVARIADLVIEQTAANYEQLPDGRPMFGVGHQGGQYIFRNKHPVEKTSLDITREIPLATVESQNPYED